MFWSRDRGSVLLVDLLLGCLIVAVITSSAAAAGMVIAAGQSVREAAREGAVSLARGWNASKVLSRVETLAIPGSVIDVDTSGGAATVTVSVRVRLPHPAEGHLRPRITATSSVPIAPYRSRRDG